MTQAVRHPLCLLFALGVVVRVLAWWLEPDLHPDEFFQYLEPAWWHLHGYGWPAWEWATGMRSWLLPSYHGAWMVLLQWIGVKSTYVMHQVLLLHWALLNALLIPVAFRLGERLSGTHSQWAGWCAAGMFTLSPLIAYFAPHTLTETASVVFLIPGLSLWVSTRTEAPASRAALLAGLCLGAGACIRLPHAPVLMFPCADWLLRRQWRLLGRAAVGALLPITMFLAIDWVTWGRPWHSIMEFVQYNVIEGRSSEHGYAPRTAHATRAWELFGLSLPLLLVPVLLGIRRTWPVVLPALLVFALLSSQHHQEDRHAVLVWPCLLIAWGTTVGTWIDRFWKAGANRWAVMGPAACAAIAIVVSNIQGLSQRPVLDYTRRWDVYRAQSWVGARTDASGVLVEGRFHLSGGYFMLGKNIPFESFNPDLTSNPIFNYAIVPGQGSEAKHAYTAGYRTVRKMGRFEVLRRKQSLTPRSQGSRSTLGGVPISEQR